MAAPTTVDEAIEQTALGPKRVKVGTQEVEQHNMDDLIKAANYTKASTATALPSFGLRMTKLVPPAGG